MEASKMFQKKSGAQSCCGDATPSGAGREEILRTGGGHFARKGTELIAILALVVAVLSLLFMMVTAKGVNTPLATVQGQLIQVLDSMARLDTELHGQKEGQLLADLAQAEALLGRALATANEDGRARLETLKESLSSIRLGLLPEPDTAVTEIAE
jgi:hypothetical protein